MIQGLLWCNRDNSHFNFCTDLEMMWMLNLSAVMGEEGSMSELKVQCISLPGNDDVVSAPELLHY